MNTTKRFRLWRIERDVKIPHLAVTVVTPWAVVRVFWYFCDAAFKAWPNRYETGLVVGWRWPWRRVFKERKWTVFHSMPMAIYGAPMDEIYSIRAVRELGWDTDNAFESTVRMFDVRCLGPTVKDAKQLTVASECEHNYWIASCPDCARRALSLAVQLKAKYEPIKLIDPREPPIIGFRRREAEAKRLESMRGLELED